LTADSTLEAVSSPVTVTSTSHRLSTGEPFRSVSSFGVCSARSGQHHTQDTGQRAAITGTIPERQNLIGLHHLVKFRDLDAASIFASAVKKMAGSNEYIIRLESQHLHKIVTSGANVHLPASGHDQHGIDAPRFYI
jgi:hypothetical protein